MQERCGLVLTIRVARCRCVRVRWMRMTGWSSGCGITRSLIESFNEDDHDNQIQLVVVTAPGKDLAGLIPQPSTSELGASAEGEI